MTYRLMVLTVLIQIIFLGSFHAEAASASNYLQNNFIDWFFRGVSFTPPATQYIALSTTIPTAASCGAEVGFSGGYARVAVAASEMAWTNTQNSGTGPSTGTSGETMNVSAISFPSPTATWGTIYGECSFDAPTGGNLLWFASLSAPQLVQSGQVVAFPPSNLFFTIH